MPAFETVQGGPYSLPLSEGPTGLGFVDITLSNPRAQFTYV